MFDKPTTVLPTFLFIVYSFHEAQNDGGRYAFNYYFYKKFVLFFTKKTCTFFKTYGIMDMIK